MGTRYPHLLDQAMTARNGWTAAFGRLAIKPEGASKVNLLGKDTSPLPCDPIAAAPAAGLAVALGPRPQSCRR